MTIAFFALAVAWLEPMSAAGVRLKVLLGSVRKRPISQTERLEKMFAPLARALPQSADRLSKTALIMTQAGFREPRHMTIFIGLRVLLTVCAFVVIVSSRVGLQSPLLLVGVPLMAFYLPRFVLLRMRKARQTNIRLGLPDALDLLTICVEAGLGLDQSLKRVGEEIVLAHPALSLELELVNLEMRAGKSRAEALRNLGLRTGVDDVRALVAVLVQTDRFGTSVAKALRVHSDSLRVERRQRAEEAAAKTSIKMVPVLVFFLFPSMFIVSIGPAMIQMIRHLLPAIQK
ncbi:MAG TPA: type II secretion system F family protein [Terriglobales bacterium]|nr:type II secretion system F family protein [Terriglobales bacterium]